MDRLQSTESQSQTRLELALYSVLLYSCKKISTDLTFNRPMRSDTTNHVWLLGSRLVTDAPLSPRVCFFFLSQEQIGWEMFSVHRKYQEASANDVERRENCYLKAKFCFFNLLQFNWQKKSLELGMHLLLAWTLRWLWVSNWEAGFGLSSPSQQTAVA